MYQINLLRGLLNIYKFELSLIVDRYDALSDKCIEDETTDDENGELDYLEEKMKLLDECADAINELLDKYGFR